MTYPPLPGQQSSDPAPPRAPAVPAQPMEPAGWYHAATDPPEVARWWDGSKWTMHTRQWPPPS